MLLMEFLHFNSNGDARNDFRYSNARDSSVLRKSDSRKVKLTLRQINQLRKQSEAHEFEKEAELEFIRYMYKPPSAPTDSF